MNPQLTADAFYEKLFITGLFWWSYVILFYGSGFFRHSI